MKNRYIVYLLISLSIFVVVCYAILSSGIFTDETQESPLPVPTNSPKQTVVPLHTSSPMQTIVPVHTSSPVSYKETGTSQYYDNLRFGSRLIDNNIWGATQSELNSGYLKSYIYVKSDESFGWKWNRPDPRRDPDIYIPPIYPEVVVGATPAESSSTTDAFPIKYGDINSWTSEVQFEYSKSPNGMYNLAYDIYWMDNDIKKFNVMIWVDGHYDGGQPIGEVSDGINTYVHYKRDEGNGAYWEWHAFELKNQGVSSHRVNIKALLDNAFQSGIIDENWTVPGMELGSEIWRGSGNIQINKYDIMMNGNLI